MNEAQQYKVDETNPNNPFLKLWNGEAGLAKSYWIWGIAAGFAWGVVLGLINPVPGSTSARVLYIFMAAYFAFVYVGIWRAANKYRGKEVWSILAKLAVVFGVFATFFPFVALIF